MKKILLVDDEPDLVETISSLLEAKGYDVTPAYDGEEALERLKNSRYDLVILDLMMPKKNGYEVCWVIKNSESLRKTPVIMLTAKSQESDKFWGYETGADEYVTKPFDPKNILLLLEKHMP